MLQSLANWVWEVESFIFSAILVLVPRQCMLRSENLCEEADHISLGAEGKLRADMEQMISKSNAWRSKAREKKTELKI